MEWLENYKDMAMVYIPIGLLIIIFLGMIASQLSGITVGSNIFQLPTFGLENGIRVIG